MFVKIKKKGFYIAVKSLKKWPSLGSNQGLADYEKRKSRFHLISFNHKVIDFLLVTRL